MNQLTVSCHSKCPVQAKALCDPWVGFISCVTGWPPPGWGTGLCCGWLCTCGQFGVGVLRTTSGPALGAAAPLLGVGFWTVQYAEKQIKTKSTLTGICFFFWKMNSFFFPSTVEPPATNTSLIRPPLYYGQLPKSRQNLHKFSLKITSIIRTLSHTDNGQ